MRIWTFFKLLAALAVLGVLGLTGGLIYHITVKPLPLFSKYVPNPSDVVAKGSENDVAKMLESSEMPDVEPGEVAYQKAVELIAMGNVPEAREKLETVVNVYPSSASAPDARRIVGEINLDEILSPDFKDGKVTYDVTRGDSYLKISEKTRCSLDCIMMLNGLTDFGGLHPGDDLIVLPLDFRILIEPQKKSLSLWQLVQKGGQPPLAKFVKDYPIIYVQIPSNMAAQKTVIDSKAGYLDGKKLVPGNKGYRQSEKILHLAKINIQIRPLAGGSDRDTVLPRGLYLKPSDMEELNLLTRTGNEVEIRPATR
ncbi:LysM peptidoglycan-binding domain-containing protein [Luteolibacter ambystomatis]|uniref:LysM peptidoglycan-binding domain-containing protein n=1 Tax=Luteolibacter ambystomatis TaxID=2824561 RepID=A0A975J017_9BACT|nr:LysM domain-containing protein [Luteolibacter ambystomatis]QUE51285.1 LysM peptidoglycan-binding domain-containing protein [Luteolibacter ambystomatis]